MGRFVLPTEWYDTPAPPPPDPMAAREEKIANDTRVESEINRFLAGRQDVLFHAPDAFYRTEGEDAIHAAPETTRRLDALRRDLIDRAANDYQRGRLGTALGAQMELTRDGMARHVAEQSLAWQRQVAQDRIALLIREAALHHGDDALIHTLGDAAANAARAHARVGTGLPGGETEDTAAATARSGVLGAAIQARLDRGDTDGAKALFTQVKDQLDPTHGVPINDQLAQGVRPSISNNEFSSPENERSAAQPPLDSGPTGTRGIAPVVEPLPGSPEYEAASDSLPGVILVLPNGDKVSDNDPNTLLKNKSDTGFMMSPVADLSAVAEAGREARKQLRGMHFTDPMHIPADFAWALLRNVGTLGKFDYQRRGPQLEGLRNEGLRRLGVGEGMRNRLGGEPIQRRQFRNVSNFNVGLFCQQAGMTLEETMLTAGKYAEYFSGNVDPAQPNKLDKHTADFIRKGYQAGESGAYDRAR